MTATAVVRAATAQDAPEIVRLAKLLWVDMGLDVHSTAGLAPRQDWEDNALAYLKEQLDSEQVRGYVAEDPGAASAERRLVACDLGLWFQQAPSFWLPNGRMGYVQWFSTEVQWRCQGLGSDILRHLLAWLQSCDVQRIQLHASGEAQNLYRRHGFVDTAYSNLWWRAGS